MKLRTLLTSIALAVGLTSSARAAISVGAGGSGVLSFGSAPAASEWATAVLPGDGLTYANAAGMDAGVAGLNAANITTTLPTSGTVPPSTSSLGFRFNTAGLYIQSRPTTSGTNAANILMATLQNDSGADISSLTITYDFGVNNPLAGELPGFEVYYSLTGAPGTWVKIPALSGSEVVGTATDTVALAGTWSAGSTMYILWADDNADGITDPSYTIDNASFVPGNAVIPLSVTLNAPANGQVYLATATVTATATTGGSTPATSVEFYANDTLIGTDTTLPYSYSLPNVPAGTYLVYAKALNATETAYSATNTITVHPAINYTGGTITENFDSMGETGTTTPLGWYVSAAPPINSVAVTPGDGSVGASGTILGWNYGSAGSSERALGTCPTGAERNMAVAIQNNAGSPMTSMEIHFDGEVWRNYTNNLVGVISNYVSVDLGATWVPTGLKFEQPFLVVEPQAAVDGNAVGNRTADINAIIGLPAPLPAGAVLLIRWWDANEGGTDGGLAIDNFSFRGGFDVFVASANLTSPANGATFAEAANITLTATANMASTITNMAFFHDGVLIGNDTNAPYSAVYSNATLGAHTLTATASDSAGNTVNTTNTVVITVNPNVPPTVTVTNPAAGSAYLVGTIVTNVSASAIDSDGTIARVEFYVDGILRMTDTSSAYGFDLADVTAGAHTLSAVAVDNAGGRNTNSISISATNPPGIAVIVPNGSDWKYFDLGTDPGATWNTAGYDDLGWSNGVAEFGYGDGPGRPERTVVSFGPNSAQKYATTYFRKSFNVGNPAAFTSLVMNVLKDDHCIVYLNGTKIYSDVTNEVVTYQSYVPGTLPEDVYVVTNAPNILNAGPNLLAVEVHQDAANSSDISFDLMLWGEGSASPKPAIGYDTANSRIVITWAESGLKLQAATDITTPSASWTDAPGANTVSPYIITLPTAVPVRFFKLVPQ